MSRRVKHAASSDRAAAGQVLARGVWIAPFFTTSGDYILLTVDRNARLVAMTSGVRSDDLHACVAAARRDLDVRDAEPVAAPTLRLLQ